MSKKHKSDNSPRIHQADKLKNSINIKPLNWTPKQQTFINLALKKDTNVIFVSGPAGASKTVLGVYAGLELLNQKKCSNILYVRAAVESADAKLGFLPGDLATKISYYGMPFQEKLDELLDRASVDLLLKEGKVEVFPVNYTRGLSWNAKYILIDEAQNLTRKELITILTRLGKFSKCVILADESQSDINGKSGGFTQIKQLFTDEESKSKGVHNFEFTEDDIMRSELCKFLVHRFKNLPTPNQNH
jgi:phosphate starvation-inducible PhoH-like protein